MDGPGSSPKRSSEQHPELFPPLLGVPWKGLAGRDDWLDFEYSSMFIVTDVTYILAFVSLLIQDKKSMPIDLEFGAYSIRLQAVLSERARALQTPVSETRGRLNIFPTYQDQNGLV
ncbi:hypothetical protein D6D18_03890 [Aureobasidium pullulans]|nr:hypothetical protein D6D26_00602 [Aureobasidium pullulans]THX02933.1 hypothetical protein D6D18_03890 [Aureobasidium pullulans]THY06853.1 hypothetical protein D6D03_02039 [Aureobasidium pullulans]